MSGTGVRGGGSGFTVVRGSGGNDEVDDLMQRMREQLSLESREAAAGVRPAPTYAYATVEDQLLADRFLKLKQGQAPAPAAAEPDLEERLSRLQSASGTQASAPVESAEEAAIAAWIAAAEEEEEELDLDGHELQASSLHERMLYMRQVLDLRAQGLGLQQLVDKACLLFAKRVLCDMDFAEALAVETTLAMLCDDKAFEKHFFGLPKERQSPTTLEQLRNTVREFTENVAKA